MSLVVDLVADDDGMNERTADGNGTNPQGRGCGGGAVRGCVPDLCIFLCEKDFFLSLQHHDLARFPMNSAPAGSSFIILLILIR